MRADEMLTAFMELESVIVRNTAATAFDVLLAQDHEFPGHELKASAS